MNPLRSIFLAASRTPPAVLIAGIVATGAITAIYVSNTIATRDAEYKEKIDTITSKNLAKTKVVFAMKDIPEGTIITAETLDEKELELSRTPQDALAASSLAIGRIAKFGITQGQIVSSRDLAPQGISLGFESHLKNGMRAVTFAVDSNSGVAGFVSPESHVDIMAMVGGGSDTRVAPILADVEVIAVGQMYEKKAEREGQPVSSVTVEVSSQDATKLIKALAASKLYLALRHSDDRSPVATVDVTSLFPRAAKTVGLDAIANLNAPPQGLPLPEPPIPNQMETTNPGSLSGIQIPTPPPLHEIEIWSGAKKDVLSVPRGG